MPRAYCYNCHKHVNALAGGSSIIGGVRIDMPGPNDLVVPIRNRHQPHYCPACGTSLITEERSAQIRTDTNTAEVMFWLVAVISFAIGIASVWQAYTTNERYKVISDGIGVSEPRFATRDAAEKRANEMNSEAAIEKDLKHNLGRSYYSVTPTAQELQDYFSGGSIASAFVLLGLPSVYLAFLVHGKRQLIGTLFVAVIASSFYWTYVLYHT